jgi:hypothetical protein
MEQAWKDKSPLHEPPRTATVKLDNGESWVLSEGLFAIYKDWCTSHGYLTRGENALAEALRKHFPEAKKSREKTTCGSYKMAWTGLPKEPPADESDWDDTPVIDLGPAFDIEAYFWQAASAAQKPIA